MRALVTKLLGKSPRALRRAAEDGDVATVRQLVDAGVPIDAITAKATPLFCAVCRDHGDVVRFLRAHGASPATLLAPDTPTLHACVQTAASAATCEALLDGVDDVDLVAGDVGLTPLMMACLFGRAAWVHALTARGADVNAACAGSMPSPAAPGDVQGFTPLAFALQNGHDELVPILLRAGARLGARLTHGFTELALAVSACGPEAVRAIVAAGADPNAPIRGGVLDGTTPLMIAQAMPESLGRAGALDVALFVARRQDVVEALRQLGARAP